jgi:ABC-type multidrug transport system fused ATPase/permease subunit
MRMAKPDATDEEIEMALKDANAWKFVKKMENGIYTNVGGTGGGVSGG